MRVAKYWRNNRLRYRLLRDAENEGRKQNVRRQPEARHPVAVRNEALPKVGTA